MKDMLNILLDNSNELNLIIFLLTHDYSLKDIEEFLNVRLNKSFFKTRYPKYLNLYQEISIETLCKLIYSIQHLHTELKNKLLKAFSYPTLLHMMTFITIVTFKKMIIPNLVIENNELILYIFNALYYFLLFLFVLLIIFMTLLLIIINNPIYFIITIEKNYQLTSFIKQYYNLLFSVIFLHLYQEGLSTQNLFATIRGFESPYVKSCLAYVMSNQLESGMSITNSIEHSNLSKQYKSVFLTGIKSNEFNQIITNFNEFYFINMLQNINKKGRYYLMSAYLFLGITIAILYRVLMIPITQIL